MVFLQRFKKKFNLSKPPPVNLVPIIPPSGGARRFRAIFLTTISTAEGLLPLIAEKDMQAKYMILMALSLAAGVIFATVLTLVLIPSLLVILNDLRLLVHRLRHGTWPRRVDVEPARNRKRERDEAVAEIHPPALITSINMEGIAKN